MQFEDALGFIMVCVISYHLDIGLGYSSRDEGGTDNTHTDTYRNCDLSTERA